MKSKYVHVSISLDEDLRTMYSFGRVNPDNPFSGGFVQESFMAGVYKKNRDCECVVYRVKISEEQYDILVREIAKFLASHKSFKYNFLGLFAAGMNIPVKRKKYYFCSQFVSELLIKSNVLNSQSPPEMIRPTDLLGIETKEEVFKGFVWEYTAFYHKNAALS
ncbi:MAG: hypothetical protein ACOYVK_09025 [Bacillota bacterium]